MDPDGGKLGTELGADDTLGSDEGLLLGILDSEGEALGPELGVSLGCIEVSLGILVGETDTVGVGACDTLG
jgi:hypothetical protein